MTVFAFSRGTRGRWSRWESSSRMAGWQRTERSAVTLQMRARGSADMLQTGRSGLSLHLPRAGEKPRVPCCRIPIDRTRLRLYAPPEYRGVRNRHSGHCGHHNRALCRRVSVHPCREYGHWPSLIRDKSVFTTWIAIMHMSRSRERENTSHRKHKRHRTENREAHTGPALRQHAWATVVDRVSFCVFCTFCGQPTVQRIGSP